MKKTLFILFAFAFIGSAIAGTEGKDKKKRVKKPKLEHGIYAEFTTSKGVIICKLEHEKTPMTVANFVGLAEGEFEFNDIAIDTPFYNGLKFHRVINDFMIQGGDPMGTGSGGPGYKFYDEIHTDLVHDGSGILSMANSGPSTNGSQFFITHKATPWLNGKHTVFGHVIFGQDIVNAIEKDDIMEKVKIIRKGKVARKWDAQENFNKVYDEINAIEVAKAERFKKIAAMSEEEYTDFMYQEVLKDFPTAKKMESGLVVVIEEMGDDYHAQKGDNMSTHYRGTFRDGGKQFDASYDRGEPMKFQYKVQRMIPGFEEGMGMVGKGGKAKLFIPYFQAYGAKGRPGAIPPYSDLVFDIEIMQVKKAPQKEHEGHDHDGHDHGSHDGHNHDGHNH